MELIESGKSRASWHDKAMILKCPRRYALSKTVARGNPTNTIQGTLVHQALAQHYSGSEHAIESIKQLAIQEYDKDGQQTWIDKINVAIQAVHEYFAYYMCIDLDWEVLGIEEELAVTAVDYDGTKVLHTQRADLIVRSKQDGLIYIVDHKTAGYLDRQLKANYSHSGQFAGYRLLGSIKYGEKFGGVIINFIEIQDGKDGPKFRFSRDRMEDGCGARDDFKHTLLHADRTERILTEIYGDPVENGMKWPPVVSQHEPCFGPYKQPCPFRDACMRGV